MASPPGNGDKEVVSNRQNPSGLEFGVPSPMRSNLPEPKSTKPVDLPFIKPKQVRPEHHRPVADGQAPSK
jgi:hypothetical protein